MAQSVWQAMKEEWNLLDLETMPNKDTEWLLHLLDGRSETVRVMILMTLWRIWHVRSEVVHHKPEPSIESSKRFLCSYMNSLLLIKQFPLVDEVKGKFVVSYDNNLNQQSEKTDQTTAKTLLRWTKPKAGTVKLNIDGSFSSESSSGGAGMVLRDDVGVVIFTACCFLPACSSALEAELTACREGLTTSWEWTDLPCIIEIDCRELTTIIQSPVVDRSPHAFIVQEIKSMLYARRNVQVVSIHRSQNNVSHTLANMGRMDARTITWIRYGTEDVMALCQQECSPDV